MGKIDKNSSIVSRRSLLSGGAAAVGGVALAGLGAEESRAQNAIVWNRTADLVIVGAGVAGVSGAVGGAGEGGPRLPGGKDYDTGGPRPHGRRPAPSSARDTP